MRRSALTTLSDVAKEAGVTAMTVSVVLNGSRSATRVSDATRTRIQEAAVRLNYRPNAVARGLSRRRMDTIGVVSIVEDGGINYYTLDVLNGILQGARDHGQNITVFSVSDWEEDERRFLTYCDGRVDGIIAIAPWFPKEFADRMARHTPMVLIHPNGSLYDSPHITSDEEGGVYAVTEYLIAQGHRDIAHFAGTRSLLGARLRERGFRSAMANAGLAVPEHRVQEGWFTEEAGRENARRLLASGEPLPTAIVCATDEVAYGCVAVLARAGVRIPEDVSIVGFDDMLHASLMQPTLTTLRQPFRHMGRRAVELILGQVHAKLGTDVPPRDASSAPILCGRRTGSQEVFDVELVHRASVGPPRMGGSDEIVFECPSD